MDPRKSATVTSPDLLDAFHEAAPRQTTAAATDLRVYVVLVDDDEVRSADDYPMAELDRACADAQRWLARGAGYGAFLTVLAEAPELFLEAQRSLSTT